MPARRLRRVLITLGILVLAGLAGLRLVPRLVPWEGAETLKSLTWSPVVLDRRGRELQVLPVNDSGLRRIYRSIDGIPDGLVSVVLRSEDRRFRWHPGVDPAALAGAAGRYLRSGQPAGGGSTVTMQLARIITPREADRPVDAGMKIREIWRALQIESRHSKKEILELYLNLVPFGRNIQGYPTAARLFFGRELEELTQAEFAVLAVIPRSPALYDPIRSPAANRRAVEELMGADAARASHARLLAEPHPWPFEAPHFCRALEERREDWTESRRRGVEALPTTLDLDLQREAEGLLRIQLDAAESFRIGNGAVLIADPRRMDILAYVGSADFDDESRQGQVDGVRMLREPGSTLKPLLYAEALEAGWTPATILPDVPTDFGGGRIYAPENYNEQFHGPVRLRRALAASLNVPAVHTLERLGVDEFTDRLIAAGFRSLEEQRGHLGVSLAVGGGEVSLAELTASFGILHSGGQYRPLRWFVDAPEDSVPIWSPETADLVTDMISRPDDRVMTFGRAGPVRFDYPAAIKTGTSNQFTNIWAVGFTSDLLGAVWMGNFDGSTVMGSPGSALPARLLHELFDARSARGALPTHAVLESRRICSLSGMQATPHCPYVMEEHFAPGTAPPPCDWHADAAGGARAEVRFPQEYAYWAQRYGYDIAFDPQAVLDIRHPAEGAVYYRDPTAPPESQSLVLRLTGSGSAVLSAGGRRLFSGALPARVAWSLEPGVHIFILEQAGRRVSRRVEVR